MRAAPMGLAYWDRGDLVEACVEQSIITHNNSVCHAASVAIAGAVKLAMVSEHTPLEYAWWEELGTLVDQVPHAIGGDPVIVEGGIYNSLGWYIRRIYTAHDDGFGWSMERMRSWILRLRDPAPWEGISGWAVSSVLWALYAFLLSPDDYWRTLMNAVWPAGDVDTTAAMAGAISGAYTGRGIPASFFDRYRIVDQGRDMFQALYGKAKELYEQVI